MSAIQTMFIEPTTTTIVNSVQQHPTQQTLNSQLIRMSPRILGRWLLPT
jgi:hypothetical protein